MLMIDAGFWNNIAIAFSFTHRSYQVLLEQVSKTVNEASQVKLKEILWFKTSGCSTFVN